MPGDRKRVRTVALAVVRRRSDGALLLGIGTDPATRRQFCRPVGGGIEEGETPEEAVRREYVEEVGVELDDVRPLAVLDNDYVYGGESRREIAHLFEARLADAALESRGEFPVAKKSLPRIARWFRPEHLGPEAAHVVPEGLWDRLRPVRQTSGPVRCIAVVPGPGGSATLAAATGGKVLREDSVASAEGLLDLLAAEARGDPEFVLGIESHRGMPGLDALRRAGLALWGPDPPRLPRVVEIDPGALAATDSATAAALAMDGHRAELLSLPTAAGDGGRIWTPWREG